MPVRWKKMENFKLELPRDTLLSVEIVQELKGEVREWTKTLIILILLDSNFLFKHFLRYRPFTASLNQNA